MNDYDLGELRDVHYKEGLLAVKVGDIVPPEIQAMASWAGDIVEIALFPDLPVPTAGFDYSPESLVPVELRTFQKTQIPTEKGVVRCWRRIK